MRERLLEACLWLAAAVLLALGHGFVSWRPAPFEPGPVPAGAYRVVTWNVGGSDDGRMRALDERDAEHVAATLAALEPGLVLLQEVGSSANVQRILGRLGMEWRAVSGRGGVCALVCAPVDVGGGGEPAASWRTPVRSGRAVGVELDVGGTRVQAAGLHAHAFSAEERNEAAGVLLLALLARPGDLHVLAGDLNLDLDLDKRRDLFTDDAHLDVETYNFVAARLDDAARGRGATAEPDRRLDYVFVTPGTEVLAAGPWKGRRAGAMDHDPVVADLRLER